MDSIYPKSKKRVAKNTFFLYVRMLIIMSIGLYTGRVILDTLGVTDYGIYNVVGGVITVASFFHSAISAASQRFISFELGRNDKESIRNVFSTSVNIHVGISAAIILLGETIGLWFVNTHLNIPNYRMIAANWVYQASIFVLVCKVLSVPYNASIIAHERMSAFAYISVVEVIMELGAVCSLYYIRYDNLIIYSLFISTIAFIIRLFYIFYCRFSFAECRYSFIYDRKLLVQMLSYAGWSIFGSLGFTGKDQIVNILLNVFSGPTANAARGIGIMVSSKVNAFSQNFTTALTPQITKQYAVGNNLASKDLVYIGSRLSFFLLMTISMPFLLNSSFVLNLWLTKVPDNATSFLQLSLLSSIIYSLSVCFSRAIEATGHVKWFQIGIFVILMSEIPAALFLLEMGAPPYAVLFPAIVSNLVAVFFRFFLINHFLPIYSFREFLRDVFLRCVVVFVISYVACAYVSKFFADDFISFIAVSFISIIITLFVIYVLGLNNSEKCFLKTKVLRFIKYIYLKSNFQNSNQ